MPGEAQDVQTDKANADQVAPSQDIDLDSAALEAERRLEAAESPDSTPADEEDKPTAAEPAAAVEEETKVPEAAPQQEEVAQDKTPDEPPDEPTEHKERTKLGRKVAELESNIGKLLEQNSLLIQRLAAPQAPPQPAPEPEPEYIDLSTPEGLDKFLVQREQQRAQAAQRDKVEYSLGYESQIKGWMGTAKETEDPDVTAIHKLLTGDTPFNVRRSSDPKVDFDYNLSRAEAHYYKAKAKTPPAERKAPLQNATPRASLAVGGESKADAGNATPRPVKISPAAAEFAKAQGWGDEEVSKILSAPIQNSFVKGRR